MIFTLLRLLCLLLLATGCSNESQRTPRVSMITSVYKGDEFIEGFLADAVRQSIFNESELILINANSPENEEPIIKEYMQKYPNIIYVRLEKDPGLYAVWNMGIKMAKAPLVTNANLDDRRNPKALEEHVKYLEEHPEIDLAYSNYLLTYAPNETFEKNTYTWVVQANDFTPAAMRLCQPGPQPTWRKSMHEKYGYFDESFSSAGDWDMWCKAVSQGAVYKKIPDLVTGLIYYNPKGLSTTKEIAQNSKSAAESHRVMLKYQYLWAEPAK